MHPIARLYNQFSISLSWQKRRQHKMKAAFFNKENKIILAISLIFFLLCLHYTSILNLWGDEASSLQLADMSIKEIWRTIDVHSPSYYLFLKLLNHFIMPTFVNETALRLIHAGIFLVGLYFCWKILKLLFDFETANNRLITEIMLFAISLPSYLFYATTIRMYALLFCFSMWYIYAVMKYLAQAETLSIKNNWDILISAIGLVWIDYAGLCYYFAGICFIWLKAPNKRDWKLWAFILSPLVLLCCYLAPAIIPSLQRTLLWTHTTGMISRSNDSIFVYLGKIIFNACKPFIELTAISFKNIYLPIMYSFLYGIFLVLGTYFFIKKFLLQKNWQILFVLCITYLWTFTAFLNLSLTRIFLPSQFFMVVLIVYGLLHLRLSQQFRVLVFATLILFNFYTAIFLTPHFASAIPYHAIAENVIAAADQLKINNILMSGNSLNSTSVSRYISQLNRRDLNPQKLDMWFSSRDIPRQKFLFLSYMDENKNFIDATQFSEKFHRKVTMIHSYLRLDQLKFNSVWKNNILEKTKQQYAYVLYLVE